MCFPRPLTIIQSSISPSVSPEIQLKPPVLRPIHSCHNNSSVNFWSICIVLFLLVCFSVSILLSSRSWLKSRSRGPACSDSMPTALVKSLKAFNSQQLNFVHSCKAGLHQFINLRPVWCQKFAVPQVEQQCTAPGTKVGFSLVNFSLTPPTPNGKKVRTCFFTLDDRFIPPTDYPSLFTMEDRSGKVSIEENLKKGVGDAKAQEEESVKLQKDPEKRKEEQEERNRVKEQDIEDKIGPPPEKPLAGDCCGQGCDVCVWDTYWEELDKYKKLRKAAEEESE